MNEYFYLSAMHKIQVTAVVEGLSLLPFQNKSTEEEKSRF